MSPQITHIHHPFTVAGATVLIEDQFSPHDSDLGGRTPDTTNTPGNTWSEIKRNWTTGAELKAQMSESADGHVGIDAEVGNCTIEVDVTVTRDELGASSGGIMARMSLNHGLLMMIIPNGDIAYLGDYAGGFNDQGSVTIDVGGTYNVKMKLDGADLTGWVDDVLLCSYSMSGGELASYPASDTVHGIYTANGNHGWLFDNFIVTTP